MKFVKGGAMAGAGRVVRRLFLSWCHTDVEAKGRLVGPLMDNLRILSGVDVSWWEDTHLRIGERWRREILRRLGECDYGVLLLSPAFFASEFIREHELPMFAGPAAPKGALPVGLKRVQLDGTQTLHGVEQHQIFTLGHAQRFFTETRGAHSERFALELAGAIRGRILGDS